MPIDSPFNSLVGFRSPFGNRRASAADTTAPVIQTFTINDTTKVADFVIEDDEASSVTVVWATSDTGVTPTYTVGGGWTGATYETGSFVTNSGTSSNEITITATTPDGSRKVTVYAYDPANNLSSPASATVTVDNTAPQLQSAVVPLAGTSVVLTYDETLTGTVAAGEYTVEANTVGVTVSTAAVSGSEVTLGLDSTIAEGQTVTVSYTGTGLQDDYENQVGSLTDEPVTNNVSSSPSLVQSSVDSFNEYITGHSVTLPSGITDGNMLILEILGGSGGRTLTVPAGWTQEAFFSGVNLVWILKKIASSDSGATVPLTFSSATQFCAIIREVVAPNENLFVELNEIDSDPPAITPAFGNAEYLFIAGATQERTKNSPTDPPSGYSGLLNARTTADSTSSGDGHISSATKVATATTEDPGTFTFDGALEAGGSYTMAVN